MRNILRIFAIRREERILAIVLLLLLLALNAIVIAHYYSLFTPLQKYYWPLFIRNFHISGFDPITLSVVSDWSAGYNVFRHPLLAFFMYPAYLLNQALMFITGINCAIFIVAAMQVASAFYADIFLYRILREITQLDRFGSTLLVALYQSFAFIMLAAMVPDHFIFSSMMLILSLYVTGRRMASRRPMKIWQTIVYFAFTAGTSLNNGLKVFLSALFVNRRKFFHPAFLLMAVLLPSLILWGIARWEYRVFVYPTEQARHKAKAKKEAAKKKAAEFAQAQRDSMLLAQGKTPEPAKKTKAKPKRKVAGTPIAKKGFLSWTDVTTPRWESLVENVFGEGIQLHKDHKLQDVLRKRPMIVHYTMATNYIVEAILVLLFIFGILCGLRSPFLWACMSYFLLDMTLHVGLGFGLNEAYIMTAHWAYVIPIAMAFFLRLINPRFAWVFRSVILLLTAFLYGWNITLVCQFLT